MKTIIEMALETGAILITGDTPSQKSIKAFAALVRADEREACKKLAKEHAAEYKVGGMLYTMLGRNTSKPIEAACDHIAHLIHERGNT